MFSNISGHVSKLIKENNESKFDQLLEHINLADEHITFAQRLYKQGALTEEERKSNEGVHFGSSLYYLITHSPKVEQALELIKIFRETSTGSLKRISILISLSPTSD